MDLRDLKYFLAMAQAGSMRRAAESVHRSQPTLTKAIDRLEASVGATLFERDGRGQRLSEAGSALLARGVPLLKAAESMREEVAALGRGMAGLVRLGTGPLGAEYLLPSVCALLLKGAPDVRMQLTIRMNYELRKQLREGQLDLVLGFVPDEEVELRCETLLKDTVVVVAAAGNPIFGERRPTLGMLSRHRWALPNASVASRVWLDQVFASRGIAPPEIQIETNSIPLAPQVIANTGLLSFISRRTLRANADQLREVRLAATTLVRNYGLTTRRDLPVSPAVTRTIELFRQHGKSLFEAADV